MTFTASFRVASSCRRLSRRFSCFVMLVLITTGCDVGETTEFPLEATDFILMARLRQCLSTLGEDAIAKRWDDRWCSTRDSVLANIRISSAATLDVDAIAELATLLNRLGRPLEATLWKSLEAYHRGRPQSEMQKLNALRLQHVASLDRKPPLDDSGRVRHRVSPGEFDPGADLFLKNDGQGGFKAGQFQKRQDSVYPGLGVVVTDLISAPGKEVFVGNDGGRVEVAEVADSSGYWKSRHLGRALAKLDFNRDGKSDVVITHIGEPSALLLNETPTDHHWLQLRLIGTASGRDGIGTRIRIRHGERESVDWLVAGDGYLSHNEPTISFGLGQDAKVDELEIVWPSGEKQTFYDVNGDAIFLVVEGGRNLHMF